MEFEIAQLADRIDVGMLFLDKKGVVKEKNRFYVNNYEIEEFNPKTKSFFDNTILSSDHKARLQRDGKVSIEVILVTKTHLLSKVFPQRRLIGNKFLELTFFANKSGENITGYIVMITNKTKEFNDGIDLYERNARWKFMSVLGKEAYFTFDLNTSEWKFSDYFERLSDHKGGDIYSYLNELSKSDKTMLMEQWGLSLTDSIPGDIFEYTFRTTVRGEQRYHSARWTLDSSSSNPMVYGLVMDITELSKTETALGESLSMVSLLSGQEDIILWVYSLEDNSFVIKREVSSEGFVEELGLEKGTFDISEIFAKISPEDAEKAKFAFTALSKGEISTINLNSRVVNQNDNCIFVVTNFVIQKTDINGRPILLMGLSKRYDQQHGDEPKPKIKKIMEETKKTILIAEDIDNNYDLLNIILRKEYKLVRAVNGVEAVKLFSEVKPDIILMDMKMPEMGGLEATKLIRMESQDVPIIAVTAFAFESDREVALEAGCNDFLSKPIDIPVLKSLIKQYIG